MKYWRSIRY